LSTLSGGGVGANTPVNCGTSYRTPDRVPRRWAGAGLGVATDQLPELLDEVAPSSPSRR
jgi:hypothetical protein